MNLHRHWWNGRWGRLARHDVKIYTDSSVWRVDAIEGGPEGRIRSWEPPNEDAALDLAQDLMADSDGWRELTEAHRRTHP